MKTTQRQKRWAWLACLPLALPACKSAEQAPVGSFAYWQARLEDTSLRGEALVELGRSHDARALEPLRTYLQQPGPQQRDAALGLGYLGDANQVALLTSHVEAGATDENQVRLNQSLVTALRALDATAAIPNFVALLASPVAQVRADAVEALGACGATSAAGALVHVFLHDPQMEISKQAGRALANIRAVVAIPELVRALYRDAMYDTARLALVQLGSHSAPLLVETLQRHNPAVESLRTSEKRPLPEGTIEARAGATLGAMRAPAGEAPVLATFTRLFQRYLANPQAADPSLFSAIIELAYAVGDYGGPQAAAALLPMVRAPQETLRTTAAEALTNAGPHPGVVSALVAMATAGSADSCNSFLETISRLGNSNDLAVVKKLAATGTPQISPAVMTQLIEDVSERLEAQQACQNDVSCWRSKTHAASDRVRERAALELGWRHADEAVDNLLMLAEDVSADARFAAVLSLARMPKARLPLGRLQKIYEVQGSKLQYAAANQELKCLIARQKDL